MKTFVATLSQLSILSFIFIMLTNSQAHSQSFQRAYGDALDNSFSKVVQDASGKFYVLGQNEAVNGAPQRATVTRLDANGQHEWTLSLNFASIWHDAVLTPSGELMLVGQTLPSDPTSKGIMARVTPAGAFAKLRTYDEMGLDLFTGIVRQNGTFPYYVIGAQYDGGASPTHEDVVLFNIDQELNVNWKKRYYQPGDDEYFRDFEALGANTLAMAGNWADGLIFISDNNGNISAGVQLPNRLVKDIHRELFGGVYAASTDGGNSDAYIQKFDASLFLLWEYRINGLSSISQVWEGLPGTGELYAVGVGDFGGQQHTVVVKLIETINELTVSWVKYLTVGSGYIGGSAWFLNSANLAFTDARTIPNGFSPLCAFISVSDLELETCEVGVTTTTLTQTDPFPNSPQPFPFVETAPITMGVNSVEASAINWQQQVACSTDPCEVTLSITPLNNCGLVQVCANATGPGPFSYQWCSGESTQCITTQIPSCSPFEFCVSVTCSDMTVATATQTYTVVDITPPVALCSGVGLDLDANCMATITPGLIDGGSSDNCQIQSMTVSPGVVSGCGLHPVTLTVTDWCGNVSTCSTSVQTIEVVPPVIVCPPSKTVACNTNTGPNTCGFATATDNCDPNPVITHVDVISGLMPCDAVIMRTWSVEDDCGNVSTCVQNIVVIDNLAPTITCPPSISVNATNPDTCTVQLNNLQLLSVTDNCSTPQILYQVTGATTTAGQNNASGLIFNLGVSTVTYTVGDACGNSTSCFFTVTIACDANCPGNVILNSDFTIGAVAGPLTSSGSLSNWQVGYGSPVVVTDFGCGDPVYVQLEGNKTNGEAIVQQLATPIQKDKVYELSICVRVSTLSGVPYVKYRGLAFNNSLPSGGTHPSPNSDIAIMDVSGRIPVCDDWTTFVFHRWRAPKNFNNIAISVENSEPGSLGLMSIGDIDNICFVEVNDSIPCYLVEIDAQGNIIPPFGQIDTDCPILDDDVDYLNGYVHDIYAYCDPAPDGLDTWYETCPDSCESIGGELPEELVDFIENDSINQYLMDSLGVNDSTLMSELEGFLDSLELAYSNVNMLDSISSLGAFAFDCRKLPPQGPPPNDPNSPFNGMDIVFVHGLRTVPLAEKYDGVQGALSTWPQNRNEFYSGYWKTGAYKTWNPHSQKYLYTTVDANTFVVNPHIPGEPIYSNRYLVVSHSATQPFFVGTHAVMEQIANAMLNGEGVINCDPDEQRPENTFGHNGFIIISHSDGAPLTDISLTISNLTQYSPLNFMLGDVSFIAERCRTHVAIQGAFGGSNYASLQLLAAAGSNVPGLNKLLAALFKDVPPATWQFNSELLDMSITKLLWGPFMDQVPVCVLTLSGGHPTDYGEDDPDDPLPFKKGESYLSKHIIQHGFDDGVLSIESQSANPDSRLFYPNRFLPKLGKLSIINPALNEKLYDMGIDKSRSIRYYLDQKSDINTAKFINPLAFACHGPLAASSGTIPWLSPSGMVQPVLIPRVPFVPACDALKRYNNHYSFIQSTADHYQGSRGPFAYLPNYEQTYDNVNDNCEESRVVTSGDVYSKCGVSLNMKNLQVEYIRGKSKTFKIFKKRYTYWVWKRKYHLLEGYKGKNQLDYLYENLLK